MKKVNLKIWISIVLVIFSALVLLFTLNSVNAGNSTTVDFEENASYPVSFEIKSSIEDNFEFVKPTLNCDSAFVARGFMPWHNGIDLSQPGGCPINSVADGTVTFAGYNSTGGGYSVEIEHSNGLKSFYYHGSDMPSVEVGETITKGQIIMNMGCTGNCTGTHLHFGILKDEVAVNPEEYVRF